MLDEYKWKQLSPQGSLRLFVGESVAHRNSIGCHVKANDNLVKLRRSCSIREPSRVAHKAQHSLSLANSGFDTIQQSSNTLGIAQHDGFQFSSCGACTLLKGQVCTMRVLSTWSTYDPLIRGSPRAGHSLRQLKSAFLDSIHDHLSVL